MRAPQAKLYYIHDPMCSWCWAFNPVRERLFGRLGDSVGIEFVLGGLAPDTDQPMPEELRSKIQQIWRTIEVEVPGTHFNYDFWTNCHPRRSTLAACRAVIAAARQAPELEREMVLAIQIAYYCEAKNPSDIPVLIDLAVALGLDRKKFSEDLESSDTAGELSRQIALARNMSVRAFPSLVLQDRGCAYQLLEIDYHNIEGMLEQIGAPVKWRSA
ncbi:MAG: DsbA family protein [Methylococcales bacterium]